VPTLDNCKSSQTYGSVVPTLAKGSRMGHPQPW
jgi:hypothetical protein